MGLGEGSRGEEDGISQMTSGRRLAIGTCRFGFLRLEGDTHRKTLDQYGTRGGTMTRKMSVGYIWRDQRKNGGQVRNWVFSETTSSPTRHNIR